MKDKNYLDFDVLGKELSKKLKGVDVSALERNIQQLITYYVRNYKYQNKDGIHGPELYELRVKTEKEIENAIDKTFPNFSAGTIINKIPTDIFWAPNYVVDIIFDTYDYLEQKCKTYWKEHKTNIKKNEGNLTDEEAIFYKNYCIPKQRKRASRYHEAMASGFFTEVIRGQALVLEEALENIEKSRPVVIKETINTPDTFNFTDSRFE